MVLRCDQAGSLGEQPSLMNVYEAFCAAIEVFDIALSSDS
jgi:hypothetical protein